MVRNTALLLAFLLLMMVSGSSSQPTTSGPQSRSSATSQAANSAGMLRRCEELVGKLHGYASVTFERTENGWQATGIRLHYDGRAKEPTATDSDLALLAELDTLKEVSITGTYGASTCRITDKGIQSLAALKHLRKLSLYRLAGDADLKPLGDLPELEELDLSTTSSDSDESDIEDLVHLKDLPKLRRLNLANRALPPAAVAHLKTLKDLEVLNLDDAKSLTDDSCAELRGLENLRELGLSMVRISDFGMAHIGELKKLQVLRVQPYLYEANLRVSGAGLAGLKKLKAMRDLSITGLDFAPEDLKALEGMTHLERLLVGGKSAHKDEKIDLSFLKGLKELSIYLDEGEPLMVFPTSLQLVHLSISEDKWQSHQPSLVAMPKLAVSAYLHEYDAVQLLSTMTNPFEMDGLPLGDSAASDFVVSAPKNLRALRIAPYGCSECTDNTLLALSHLENLESLEIGGGCCSICDFSGKGVSALGSLRHLTRLELHDVTADGFGGIPELKGIVSLTLTAGMPRTAATAEATSTPSRRQRPTIDEALAKWGSLSKLEELSISGTTLGDGGLKHLAAVKSLRSLNLEGCSGFSAAGLSILMDSVPGLETVKTAFRTQASR